MDTNPVALTLLSRLELLGYHLHVVMLEDGQFYWHVYRKGMRINGGLSETQLDAWDDAEYAAVSDNSARITRPYHPLPD